MCCGRTNKSSKKSVRGRSRLVRKVTKFAKGAEDNVREDVPNDVQRTPSPNADEGIRPVQQDRDRPV